MNWKLKPAIRKLIPFYVNGTLSEKEKKAVEGAINNDEQARGEVDAWIHIQSVISDQPQQDPSPMIWQRVLAAAHTTERGRQSSLPVYQGFLAGAKLTISILVSLWLVIRPGVMLQWSVERDGMINYRIYRASQGSSQFELIKEVTAQIDRSRYNYVDTSLIPGKDYVYRVEAIPPTGAPTFSQVVQGRYLEILPGQLAILLTSIITGYGIVFLIHSWPALIKHKSQTKLAV
jgi:hypothetical protein